MHEFISETAQYGDLTRGPYVIDGHARARMRKILAEIQDGTFARQWIAEYQSGNANYKALKQADLEHPIEATGRKLRAAMPWQIGRASCREHGCQYVLLSGVA